MLLDFETYERVGMPYKQCPSFGLAFHINTNNKKNNFTKRENIINMLLIIALKCAIISIPRKKVII